MVAVSVRPEVGKPEVRSVAVQLLVAGQPLPHGGDDEISRGTRLHWLDSRLGLAESLPAPYTPLLVSDRSVSMLGKTLQVDSSGAVHAIVAGNTSVMAQPLRLDVRVRGTLLRLTGGSLE